MAISTPAQKPRGCARSTRSTSTEGRLPGLRPYPLPMSVPRVVAVDAASPAYRAGLRPGDELSALNGRVPRDIIQYQLLADEAEIDLDVRRGGLELTLRVEKVAGEPLGIEIHSPLFDQVRTCDNDCEFCFIYQLPKGLRPSLYVKDDDYRLSFLYGNFTPRTRFTVADLERVVEERLSPLFVSIHATEPDVRARMLRNRRGATSLRWLRALLDHGIEVHGQVVCCPGVNDGEVLHDTLAGVLDQYPELETVAVVPLGVSRGSAGAGDEPGTAGVASWTGEYGAAVIEPLLERLGRPEVRVIAVRNEFFGGNIAVAGLIAGADVARELAAEPGRGVDVTYLLPDVCLSQGRFLDGLAPEDLPRPVQVVPSDGLSLRRFLLGAEAGRPARRGRGR